MISTGGVRRIPVSNRHEYSFGMVISAQMFARQYPIARTVFFPGGLHVAGHITDVKMKASI